MANNTNVASVEGFENPIIDIRFYEKSVQDVSGNLTPEDALVSSAKYRDDMSEFNSNVPALIASEQKDILRYSGEVATAGNVTIEVYGVFGDNASEIFMSAFGLEVTSAKMFQAWDVTQGGSTIVKSANPYDMNVAHHVVLVGQPNSIKLYVDGVEAGTTLYTADSDTLTDPSGLIMLSNAVKYYMSFRAWDKSAGRQDVSNLYEEWETLGQDDPVEPEDPSDDKPENVPNDGIIGAGSILTIRTPITLYRTASKTRPFTSVAGSVVATGVPANGFIPVSAMINGVGKIYGFIYIPEAK